MGKSSSPPTMTFLSLPAEIRGLIYEHALTGDNLVTFRLDTFQRQSYTEAVQPALLRVNRQVRAEALPIFYASNEFVLHTEEPKAADAERWLMCNAPHLPLMRHLSFWVRYLTPLHNHRFLTNQFRHVNAGAPSPFPASQGAVSVSIVRRTRVSDWAVDGDWRWITVMRKPNELAADATFIVDVMRDRVASLVSKPNAPEEYIGLMKELKTRYTEQKVL